MNDSTTPVFKFTMENKRIIKRYSNRKLYDIEAKHYVTLKQLRDMLYEGIEIKVIDNDTNEDISKQTLAKIIVEDTAESPGLLPVSVLRDVLVKSRESVFSYIKKTVQTGRDAITQLETDAQKQLQKLVDKGAASEEEARKIINEFMEKADKGKDLLEKTIESQFQATLTKLNIFSYRDFEQLILKIEKLEKRLDALEERLNHDSDKK